MVFKAVGCLAQWFGNLPVVFSIIVWVTWALPLVFCGGICCLGWCFAVVFAVWNRVAWAVTDQQWPAPRSRRRAQELLGPIRELIDQHVSLRADDLKAGGHIEDTCAGTEFDKRWARVSGQVRGRGRAARAQEGQIGGRRKERTGGE